MNLCELSIYLCAKGNHLALPKEHAGAGPDLAHHALPGLVIRHHGLLQLPLRLKHSPAMRTQIQTKTKTKMATIDHPHHTKDQGHFLSVNAEQNFESEHKKPQRSNYQLDEVITFLVQEESLAQKCPMIKRV